MEEESVDIGISASMDEEGVEGVSCFLDEKNLNSSLSLIPQFFLFFSNL
jgi:hypothetical protein